MGTQGSSAKGIRKLLELNRVTIGLLVFLTLLIIMVLAFVFQMVAEQDAFTLNPGINPSNTKEQYEIAKLAAEIREIRSDTSGSLFWLKMIALFVTVGGAVGGYLIGQSKTTRNRIEAEERLNRERSDFEHNKNVDAVYHSYLQELSGKSALLRAAAAVKLGAILESFPAEWHVNIDRRNQINQLTKQVLTASLSIEADAKVLKTLTIALVLHKSLKENPKTGKQEKFGDVQGLDFSDAKAADAYWAKVDFTYTDFYRADLTRASFRNSILRGAQFREAKLKDAVLIDADCEGANFKFADLRGADLTRAKLVNVKFEEAKVHGVTLTEAIFENNPEVTVDISPEADGSELISFSQWRSGSGS